MDGLADLALGREAGHILGMTQDSQIQSRQDVERSYPFLADAVPTYDGSSRLLDWKQSAKDGMIVDIAVSFPGPLGGHPFRGMSTGKENGQRFFVMAALGKPADGGVGAMIYQGEALLMRWSENDRTGMMVRMMLDDGPDGVRGRHPFFGLDIGRLTGAQLDFVAWGVGDDERGLPASRLRKRTPFHTLTEVQQSNILCRNASFRAFLLEHLEQLVVDDTKREGLMSLRDNPEQFATAVVRSTLNVSSRSVMNQDTEAAHRAIASWRSILSRYESWAWGIRR